MRIKMNVVRWYDRLWAAFAYFTGLPILRLYRPPRGAFSHVADFWPLTGWLTGLLMALTIYFGSILFPYLVAVVLAVALRALLTRAMHEGDLCSFVDGLAYGRGSSENAILAMTGASVGKAGVVGLVVYALLLCSSLGSVDYLVATVTVFAADPFSKMVAAQLTMMMPRSSEFIPMRRGDLWEKPGVAAGVWLAVQGLLPMAAYLYYMGDLSRMQYVVFVPCLLMYALYVLLSRRLHGHTPGSCGAVALLVELSVYLVVASIYGGE